MAEHVSPASLWIDPYRFSAEKFNDASNHDLAFFQRITSLFLAIVAAIFSYPIYLISTRSPSALSVNSGQVDPDPVEANPLRSPLQAGMPPLFPGGALRVASVKFTPENAVDRLRNLNTLLKDKVDNLEIPQPWQRVSIAGGEKQDIKVIFKNDLDVLAEQLCANIKEAGLNIQLKESKQRLTELYASMVWAARANDPDHPRPFHRGRVSFANKKTLSDCGWVCRSMGAAHSSRLDYVLIRPIQRPAGSEHTHAYPRSFRQTQAEMMMEEERHHYYKAHDQRQISHKDLIDLQQRLLSVVRALQTGEGTTDENPAWKYYNGNFTYTNIQGNEVRIKAAKHASGYHFITDLLRFLNFTWEESWLPFPVERYDYDHADLRNLNIDLDPKAPNQVIVPAVYPHIQRHIPEVEIRDKQMRTVEYAAAKLGIVIGDQVQVEINEDQRTIVEDFFEVTLLSPPVGQKLMANVVGTNLEFKTNIEEAYVLNFSGKKLLEKMFDTDWRIVRILANRHYRLMYRNSNDATKKRDFEKLEQLTFLS